MENANLIAYILTFVFLGFIALKIHFKFRRLRIERNADKLLKELKRREKEDK